MRFRTSILGAGLLLLTGCGHKAAPPAKPADAAAPAPVQLTYEQRMGQGVYQHYCQTCHGDQGAGDGFNAFNIDPHPRDLSDPAFQKAKSDAELADTVRRGGGGVGLSPFMPPWGKTLTADEVDQVVSYVRTLKRAPEPPAQP